MTLNVWERILPAQRKMIAAAAAGASFDASLGAQAKLRSKHNTFMSVPVVFIMISNHFPVATYGNSYGWIILVGLVVAGWAAAAVIRRAVGPNNEREHGDIAKEVIARCRQLATFSEDTTRNATDFSLSAHAGLPSGAWGMDATTRSGGEN